MGGPTEKSWVASLHRTQNDYAPFAAGLVLDNQRVLTCAHVTRSENREHELWVGFPMSESNDVRCRVESVDVCPGYESTPHSPADVAILHLKEVVPEGVHAAPLSLTRPRELVGLKWWAFGFPGGNVRGNEADGTVGAELSDGWVRLETTSSWKVEQGFSGGGLWSPGEDGRPGAVIGLVSTAMPAGAHEGDAQALTLFSAHRRFPQANLAALAGQAPDPTGSQPDDPPDPPVRSTVEPSWRLRGSGPWTAFRVGDGLRLLHVADGHLLVSDTDRGRPLSRHRLPVPVTQLVAADDGNALVASGDGQLLVAAVDSRCEVGLRGDMSSAPEDGLTLLGAAVQRDVVRVIGSSVGGTIEFRMGTRLTLFALRRLAESESRAAVSLPGGTVRVDPSGTMVRHGQVSDAIQTLPDGGWKSLDYGVGEGASILAGVRTDSIGDWLHAVRLTAQGPTSVVVALEGTVDRVQVCRTTRRRAPTAILVQVGQTVVGWPWEDLCSQP